MYSVYITTHHMTWHNHHMTQLTQNIGPSHDPIQSTLTLVFVEGAIPLKQGGRLMKSRVRTCPPPLTKHSDCAWTSISMVWMAKKLGSSLQGGEVGVDTGDEDSRLVDVPERFRLCHCLKYSAVLMVNKNCIWTVGGGVWPNHPEHSHNCHTHLLT